MSVAPPSQNDTAKDAQQQREAQQRSQESINRLRQQAEESRRRRAEREQRDRVQERFEDFKAKTRAKQEKAAAGQQSVERLKQQIQESRERRQRGTRVRAGPTTTREEGEFIIEETPQIDLPAPEVTRRGAAALRAETAAKQAEGGGRITASDIEARRTAAIAKEVAATGGVTIQKQNGAALAEFQQQRHRQLTRASAQERAIPIAESDMPILTPERGLRGRSTFSGFTERGGKTTLTISAPEVTKEAVVKPPPPDDFLVGLGSSVRNIGKLFFVGIEGGLDPVGAARRELRPSTQIRLERETEAETLGAIASGRQDLTIGGLPVGGSVLFTEQSFKNLGAAGRSFSEAPSFFIGSAVGSIALWLSPLAGAKLVKSLPGLSLPRIAQAAQPRQSIFRPQFATIRRQTDDFAPRLESPITVRPPTSGISQKRITTLADIDKRLGLGVTDKGGFTEVKTRGGQTLIMRKPIQEQKTITITKQESKLVPKLQGPTQKQQSSVIQRFTLGLGGQTGFERVLAKRTRRQLGIPDSVFAPTIESEAIRQAQGQSIKTRQDSIFGKGQQFGDLFKPTQLNRVGQKQSFQFKFEPAVTQAQLFQFGQAQQQRQQFKFATALLQRQQTTQTRLKSPPPPEIPIILFGETRPRRRKKERKGKAQKRTFRIPIVPAVFFGRRTKTGRSFEKNFGKLLRGTGF